MSFEVRFPFHYPYFPFKVFAPTMDFAHHQNPFDKHLCLLSGVPEAWNTTDTIATVIDKMFPMLRVAGNATDPAVAAPLEVDQAEPFSSYYVYGPTAVHWDGD